MTTHLEFSRLTRGEYWLLEAVAEHMLFVDWLCWKNLEPALNKQGHGMTLEETAATFWRLYSAGLLCTKSHQWGPILFNYDDIFCQLANPGDRDIWYGLTPKGGRVWEAFAAPNWNAFIDVSVGNNDTGEWDDHEVASENKRSLEIYMREVQKTAKVDEASIRWLVLRPWQATYWKVRVKGHRLTFNCRTNRDSEGLAPHWEWLQSLNRSWYRWQ